MSLSGYPTFLSGSPVRALDICSEATVDSAHGAWNTGGARWDGQSQSGHIYRRKNRTRKNNYKMNDIKTYNTNGKENV